VLSDCQFLGGDEAQTVLSLFKSHEDAEVGTSTTVDTSVKTIDTINYSDVVRFDNWMKNVE
jgi:hypothetical protein